MGHRKCDGPHLNPAPRRKTDGVGACDWGTGPVYKTRYLFAYLDDEGYRRRILTQLNGGKRGIASPAPSFTANPGTPPSVTGRSGGSIERGRVVVHKPLSGNKELSRSQESVRLLYSRLQGLTG